MVHTADQIAQMRQAIADLAAGKRVAMVVKDGRTVQYAQASLPALREELHQMLKENKAAAGGRRSRTRYAVTSKGL